MFKPGQFVRVTWSGWEDNPNSQWYFGQRAVVVKVVKGSSVVIKLDNVRPFCVSSRTCTVPPDFLRLDDVEFSSFEQRVYEYCRKELQHV